MQNLLTFKTGLSVHMTQVHKETLTTIDNALPNRSGLDVEIFGMEGIPEDIVQSHNQRVIGQFAQAEAERRAATGNPGPGGAGGNGVKKPKFESPADLKKRLAEHKAKVAIEQAAGGSSGDVTPLEAGFGNMSPGPAQSPGVYVSGLIYSMPGADGLHSRRVLQVTSKARCPMGLRKIPSLSKTFRNNTGNSLPHTSSNRLHSRSSLLALGPLQAVHNFLIASFLHRLNNFSHL